MKMLQIRGNICLVFIRNSAENILEFQEHRFPDTFSDIKKYFFCKYIFVVLVILEVFRNDYMFTILVFMYFCTEKRIFHNKIITLDS